MTIKETAGKVLLYLYQLQRTVPSDMQRRQLGFIGKADGKVSLTSDKKWFTKDLLDINPASSDIYNAFLFLLDKDMIRSNERNTAGAKIFIEIRLTDKGFDVVEGVEYGREGKNAFSAAFNINVEDRVNVETLVKETLGVLLK